MSKKRKRPRTPPRNQTSDRKRPPGVVAASAPLAMTRSWRPLPPDPPPLLLRPRATLPQQPTVTTVGDAPQPGDVPVDFVRVPFPVLADTEPQALGVTYRFPLPPGQTCPPMRLTVRGRHRAPDLAPEAGTFTVTAEVPALPARGEATFTVRALDLAAGDWQVSVEPELLEPTSGWRPPRASGQGRTAYAPVVRSLAPGVVLGAWPGLVLLGVILGTLTMTLLANRLHLPTGQVLLAAVLSSMLGAVGGKGYFLALHRDRQIPGLWQTGMAIQGFILGSLASMVTASALLSLPVGRVLDVTVAGLLVGLTVGRLGCFFGGCCAGRPTTSRWGRWSSDRILGVRRIPTQLLESAGAGVLAIVVGLFVWNDDGHTGGIVAVAGLAAYTELRQLLFPYRSVPRTTRYGRVVVLAATAATVVAVIVLIVRQG